MMADFTVGHDSYNLSLLKKSSPCQLTLSKKYRSHFEIIAEILDALKYDTGDKYSLMKRTGINYAQLKKYLTSITKIGFVEIRMRGQQILYCATDRGQEFLRQYYVLLGMLINTYTLGEQHQSIYQTAYAPLKKS
jgi:predicted transcriptional regulator